MNLGNLTMFDYAGILVGLFLTLSIFSYLLGDNALFRFAVHLFIGVSAGYLVVVTWYNIIFPKLLLPLLENEGRSSNLLTTYLPLIFSLLLLTKLVPRLSGMGSPIMAYLIGIGAATAIGGAIMGTLFPQIISTINLFDGQNNSQGLIWYLVLESSFILIGTLSTLIYFHFGARSGANDPGKRAVWIESIAGVGKIFIAITFGAIFANVLIASLTAFVERWNFIGHFFLSLFQS